MSKLLQRNISFLREITESTLEQRREIIKGATEDNIKALTELSINLLEGNLPLSNEDKLELSKHKLFIRSLSHKEVEFTQKKKKLLHNCNILPMIITPLLSVVGSILGKCVVTELF